MTLNKDNVACLSESAERDEESPWIMDFASFMAGFDLLDIG